MPVTIFLNTSGTVQMTVNWGDGTSDSYNSPGIHSHTYQNSGAYNVSIYGTCTGFNGITSTGGIGTSTINPYFKSIQQWGQINLQNLTNSCQWTNTNFSVPNTLPNTVIRLDSMFSNSAFNQNVSNWNTNNVISMNAMFSYATLYNQNLDAWCVKKLPIEPVNFALGASSWSSSKPNWGTCPGDPPTYSISPSTLSVNEGSSVTWTITTTNFGTGTLYWTNSGTTDSGDFDDGTNSGSISIVNNTGTLTKALSSDYSTEGSETIIIQLRTGSTGGTIVATSDTVTVQDTSTALPYGNGRYFKWEILGIRGPGTLSATGIQAAELILGRYNPLTATIDKFSYAGATASQPTGTTQPTETPDKLVDNNNGTKWFTATTSPIAIIDFGSVKSANAFAYVTANDRQERDPVQWKLYTSPNGTNWTLVHDQSGSSATIPTTRAANTQVFFF